MAIRLFGFCLTAWLLLPILNASGEERFTQPTQANVPYGVHERHVLDFYKAESSKPTPVFFFIHGGGWMNGDKKDEIPLLRNCLASGISVVSINYRFIPDGIAGRVTPPVKVCFDDAARALQFVRSKAAEWNIDSRRICVSGGSAGGFGALWLTFHPDLANPQSDDPVERESTRVNCAMTFVPQTSLDPLQMRQWIPNNEYGGHAFALANYQEFLDKRRELMRWIKEYSPYELVSSDDPPVYLFYDTPLAPGQPAKDPPHSSNFGAGLVEKLKSKGVEYEFNYPGASDVKHPDLFGFVVEQLKVTAIAPPPLPVSTATESGPNPSAATSPHDNDVTALLDLNNLSKIKTNHSSIRIVEAKETKVLQTECEEAEYPGIEFPMNGEKDFSAYTGIEMDVTNAGTSEIKVALRVDNDGDWKKEPFNCEVDTLMPGATKRIAVTFGRSWGGEGYPLDPTRITRILIFVPSPSQPAIIQIQRLTPFGTRAEKPGELKNSS